MSADKYAAIKAAPDREGFLTKQGGWVKNWKVRWFVLKSGMLYYFHNKSDPEPRGEFPLQGGALRCIRLDYHQSAAAIRAVDAKDAKKLGKKNLIEIKSGERTLFVHTETAHEMEDWLTALTKPTQVAAWKKEMSAQVETSKVVWSVKGVMCERCVEKLKTATARIPGVVSVEVNMEEETVTVYGKFEVADITTQLEEFGYLPFLC